VRTVPSGVRLDKYASTSSFLVCILLDKTASLRLLQARTNKTETCVQHAYITWGKPPRDLETYTQKYARAEGLEGHKQAMFTPLLCYQSYY
jgi:hypothetical protein